MDLIDQLRVLSANLPRLQEFTKTEEATKHALVLPFIRALGYDVFSPLEVVPEFVADVGSKKGEKVDYAIFRDGKPAILFECKTSGANLDAEHHSQLSRYFHVTPARIGILTNGVQYRFFADLDEANKMDVHPFFEFNLADVKEHAVEELKRFSKSQLDIDTAIGAARELKYLKEIHRVFGSLLERPSEDFARFLLGQVYSGVKTAKVIEQFQDLAKRAFSQFIADKINERLKAAMNPEPAVSTAATSGITGTPAAEQVDDKGVVTTEDELEACRIIKSILREAIDPRRIALRDAQSYCAVLLDDNNRKPICRLRFTHKALHLGLINPDKSEERVTLTSLDDLYKYGDRLKATALGWP